MQRTGVQVTLTCPRLQPWGAAWIAEDSEAESRTCPLPVRAQGILLPPGIRKKSSHSSESDLNSQLKGRCPEYNQHTDLLPSKSHWVLDIFSPSLSDSSLSHPGFTCSECYKWTRNGKSIKVIKDNKWIWKKRSPELFHLSTWIEISISYNQPIQYNILQHPSSHRFFFSVWQHEVMLSLYYGGTSLQEFLVFKTFAPEENYKGI